MDAGHKGNAGALELEDQNSPVVCRGCYQGLGLLRAEGARFGGSGLAFGAGLIIGFMSDRLVHARVF